VHTDGCFDIEQEVAQDGRRPQQWVDAAKDFADRLVNGELGSIGDPTKLKENPKYRLGISTVPGNSGFRGPLCGKLKETPTPEPTPTETPGGGGGGGGGGGHGKPSPTILFSVPAAADAAGSDSQTGTTAGLIPSLLGATTLFSLVPIAGRLRRRSKRR